MRNQILTANCTVVLLVTSLVGQPHRNRKGSSRDCKADVVRLTNSYDQENLEPYGLNTVEWIVDKRQTNSSHPPMNFHWLTPSSFQKLNNDI